MEGGARENERISAEIWRGGMTILSRIPKENFAGHRKGIEGVITEDPTWGGTKSSPLSG